MIGEEETALWRQAVESVGALDVYLDWLLIHDPRRGELLRKRMQHGTLSSSESREEMRAWAKVLDLDGFEGLGFWPVPTYAAIDARRLPLLEHVIEQLPFLWIVLELDDPDLVEPALASPVVAKLRRLGFTARQYEHDNGPSVPWSYFGSQVVAALCASPNLARLEGLQLNHEPGRACASLVAAAPFVALRELSISDASIGDAGVIAIATSPLGKTLRRLALVESEIGDAGALALVRCRLEELAIDGHRIGPSAAAALRAMPSLKRLTLVPEV